MFQRIAILAAALTAAPFAAVRGQTPAPPASNGIRVFLDCRFCPFDHFRREIPWLNYVRDRQVAQVHMLGTRQETGSGREYRFHFIGLGDFVDRSDTLIYRSSQTDTEDETRDGLTRIFAIGMLRYAAELGSTEGIEIGFRAAGPQRVVRPEEDPWNHWVFRISGGGNLRGETDESGISVDGRLTANRVTEEWKIEARASGRYSRNTIELSDTSFVNASRNWELEALIVNSLGDHWATGGQGELAASTFSNQDFRARFAWGVEYSLFPYAESTRRQLTALYTLGLTHFDWEEVTLFGETGETRLNQSLEVDYEVLQPWGSIRLGAEASSYLHDPGLHRLQFGGGYGIRIVRGLEFGMRGSVARIKDQINLPAGGISDEDILVRRRQRGTDFRYSLNFDVSYTFGSIFNNAVNPRMGGP